jgi:hypothetical protein
MTETCCSDLPKNDLTRDVDLKIRLDSEGKFLGLYLDGQEISLSGGNGEKSLDLLETQGVQIDASYEEARNTVFRLIRNAAVALFVVILSQFLLARWYESSQSLLAERYGLWIFYLDISVVALVSTLSYVRSYVYSNAGHVVGMLIGMTIGMQVGTMVGGVLGATNGFFVGSMVGILLGAFYGVITAWCCGSAAVLHGLMGGAMGGPMGAMVVVMMLPDNIQVFMPFFTGINVLILMYFTYIFYRECVVQGHCPTRKPLGLPALLFATVLTTTGLAAIVLFGPRGPMALQSDDLPDGAASFNPFDAQAIPGKSTNHHPEMGCGAMMKR